MSRDKRSAVCDYGGTTDKYTWDQTQEDVSVSITMPKDNLKGKDVVCQIDRLTLKVGLKGEPLLIDGNLGGEVKTKDCTWCLVDGKVVEISLQKKSEGWWKSLIEGDQEIDLDLIEGSKYLDDSLLRKIKEQKKQKAAEEAAAGSAPAASGEATSGEKEAD